LSKPAARNNPPDGVRITLDPTAVRSSETTPAARLKAGRREWIGLAVIALPCLLYAMDLTVLNLAVPALSMQLQPTSAQLLWIVDIYGFLVAGSLITMGTLGDRIGRRKLLLVGAAAFAVTSVFAAFARSAETLIAARALLGLAGATVAPSTLSLIRNMFHDPRERTVAVGIWISSYSAGGALGPLLGGVMLEYFHWGSVFLLAVPVMGLLLCVGPFLLPEYRDPNAGRLDLLSAAMSLIAVLAIIYGLKEVAQAGIGWIPALAIAGGVFVGGLFIRRQRGLRDPLIDLRLFKIPAFSAALAAYTIGTFVAFGVFVFIAQYLQMVLGLSPLKAGLWMLPSFAGFITGSMLSPVIVRRVRPAVVITAGLILSAAGFGLLTQVHGPYALPIIVTAMAVYSLGLAPVFTLTTDIIIGSAPPERTGAASAISETGSEFGGALGIAILGSLGAAWYRTRMEEVLPVGLSAGAAEAARSTLGGAVSVSASLPSSIGEPLLQTAYQAFAWGLQWTAALDGVVVLLTAWGVWVFLRDARTT
jgi:MFS transporter, DHA2 family, multidrug resistance protein